MKVAIRNAAVLPVPVWAWPATSLPRSATGSAASWIGVAIVKPAARNALLDLGRDVELGEAHGVRPPRSSGDRTGGSR